MTRSMSDEQILAKYGYDKEPVLHLDGHRSDGSGWMPLTRGEYAPRPECIPSPDPKPFVRGDGSVRHRHNPSDAGLYPWCKFKPRPWGSFTPDPEFVRTPVNPILSAFRDDLPNWQKWPDVVGNLREALKWWIADFDIAPEIPDTRIGVASARVILERLARLQAVSA